MVVLTYAASVLVFMLAFHHLGLVAICQSSLLTMRSVAYAVTDKAMDDSDKEAIVRQAGLLMMQMSLRLLVKSLLLLIAVLTPVWLSDFAGLSSFSQTAEFALRADVIVLTVIAVYLFLLLFRKTGITRRSGQA